MYTYIYIYIYKIIINIYIYKYILYISNIYIYNIYTVLYMYIICTLRTCSTYAYVYTRTSIACACVHAQYAYVYLIYMSRYIHILYSSNTLQSSILNNFFIHYRVRWNTYHKNIINVNSKQLALRPPDCFTTFSAEGYIYIYVIHTYACVL